MIYNFMEPPFPVKPFSEMNKKEARMHFEWYISEIPNRIQLLSTAFEITKGGNKEELDYSENSLEKIWAWYLSIVKLVPKSKQEIDNESNNIPNWVKSSLMINPNKLHSDSLVVAMDIAIYFAETIIYNFDGIKWGLITSPKSFVSVNRPILIGFKNNTDLDPSLILNTFISKIIKGDRNLNGLFEVYNVWKGYVKY